MLMDFSNSVVLKVTFDLFQKLLEKFITLKSKTRYSFFVENSLKGIIVLTI
jgi:hypothetical protein